MTLYLIRHGETEANAARVLQQPEMPLSARGQAQARRLGERLAEAWGSELAGPPALLGAMAAVRLPREALAGVGAVELAGILDRDHDQVVAVNEIDGDRWLRVSAAIYNEPRDCEGLLAAVAALSGERAG